MKQEVIRIAVIKAREFFTEWAELFEAAPTPEPVPAAPTPEPVPAAPTPEPVPATPTPEPVPAAGPAPTPEPVPAAEPVPVAGVEYDTEGLPWDARIHSSGKTKYVRKAANGSPAGSWKLKKGLDPVYVAQIKTELAKAQGATSVPTPQAQPAAQPAGQAQPAAITTWGQFMQGVVKNNLDRAMVDQKCAELGAVNMMELQNNPDLIPAVCQAIGLPV